MEAKAILIVEDEPAIADTLKMYLANEGFEGVIVPDGIQAIQTFYQIKPILILLDLNLPGKDGVEVCKTIRSTSNVPIIMVTARDEEQDKLRGLEIGADDYITKPFSVREVIARVKVLLRRVWGPETDHDLLIIDDLLINRKSMQVWKSGEETQLTPTEFRLLETLMKNAGAVLSRQQIIVLMYGYSYEGYDRTLDSHIKNLRQKLEDHPQKPKYILTVVGEGYQFKRPER